LIRLIASISFLIVSVSWAETSMFGAGNLDSPEPYGLTKAEAVIVKNKKIVTKNEKTLKKTNTQLQDLNERVGGIESLLEGESLKLNKVSITLNKTIENFTLYSQTSTNEINKNSEIIANMQNTIDADLKKIKLQIEQNNKNLQTIQKSFDKIVVLVNDINSKYVTKDEFNKLLLLLDKKLIDNKTNKKDVSSKKNENEKKSKKEQLKDAKAYFKKDYFTKALPIFENLISQNYRPAECNFYVGEIKYYRKKYKEALHYFKNSMTLYDKAKYLPKLLLHSAVSFEKLGDNDNAQNFYNTIVEIYPESIEAKEASKKIKT